MDYIILIYIHKFITVKVVGQDSFLKEMNLKIIRDTEEV